LLILRGPFREGLLERAESEEEVLRLVGDRRRAANLAHRVLQLERIEEPPAVLALVAAGARESAVGAGPFHVPVRQEPLVRRAERGGHRRLVDVAFRLEREEDLLHPLFVMRIGGVPVEVILHAKLRELGFDNHAQYFLTKVVMGRKLPSGAVCWSGVERWSSTVRITR